MKQLLIATALAALPFSALAADLPMRSAAPAPAPMIIAAHNWTGFYLGAHAGGTWGVVKEGIGFWEDTFTSYTVSGSGANSRGAVGGVAAGYNFQSGPLVYGVEIDASIASSAARGQAVNFDVAYGPTDPILSKTNIDGLFTGRARVGYAVDDMLFYATGGVALGHIKRKVTGVNAGLGYAFLDFGESNSFSDFRTGWTLGGGVEKVVTTNLTARIQYLYTDFGKVGYNYRGFPFGFLSEGNQKVRLHQSSVTIGLYYNFGGSSAPVVARY